MSRTNTILKRFDDLLLVLVLIVCAELTIYILFPEVTRTHYELFHAIDAVVVTAFGIEVFLRYFEYRDLKRFLKEHWLSVLALFIAMGITRIIRIARAGTYLMEEEIAISRVLPKSMRAIEAPVILGKVGKIGAYAQRRWRVSHTSTWIEETCRGNHAQLAYLPFELKEIRDAVLK